MEEQMINELGQAVPVLGQPFSPSRIRTQFPQTFTRLLLYLRDNLGDEHFASTRAPNNIDRKLLESWLLTNMPHIEMIVIDAFWRAFQCERDLNKLNKLNPLKQP